MAIKKHSKIINDPIVFNYLYTCPDCGNIYTSKTEQKNKKCSKCGKEMQLTGTTM